MGSCIVHSVCSTITIEHCVCKRKSIARECNSAESICAAFICIVKCPWVYFFNEEWGIGFETLSNNAIFYCWSCPFKFNFTTIFACFKIVDCWIWSCNYFNRFLFRNIISLVFISSPIRLSPNLEFFVIERHYIMECIFLSFAWSYCPTFGRYCRSIIWMKFNLETFSLF